MPKLSQKLTEDQWEQLLHQRTHHWVTQNGVVACKDPRSGCLGTGKNIRQAFEDLQRKMKHVK